MYVSADQNLHDRFFTIISKETPNISRGGSVCQESHVAEIFPVRPCVIVEGASTSLNPHADHCKWGRVLETKMA
jgi:hypothetical protein